MALKQIIGTMHGIPWSRAATVNEIDIIRRKLVKEFKVLDVIPARGTRLATKAGVAGQLVSSTPHSAIHIHEQHRDKNRRLFTISGVRYRRRDNRCWLHHV